MFRQHHRHIKGAIALALALGLYAAPVAWADPQPLAKAEAAIAATPSPGNLVVRPNPDEQVTWPRTQSPAIVRVAAANGGFDWGDASLGVGGALVLVGLGLGAARAITNSRRRRTREQHAIGTN
jgi:hypothetical protein